VSRSRIMGWTVGVALGAALLSAPAALEAQGGDGFLFREPRVGVGVRLGYGAPIGPRTAGGDTDIFGFTQDILTIGEGDYDALVFGGEVSLQLSSRIDLLLDLSSEASEVTSEFRDWVDQDDLPIQQTTEFIRRPINLSARYFLWERGRRVSQFAWVPRDWVPYVGAGAGMTWYRFRQEGEFVDFDTLEIFSDRLTSTGRAFTGQVLAGLQYTLAPNFVMTGEGRYRFGSGEMDGQFVGFDDIDLSGLQLTVGLGVRF